MSCSIKIYVACHKKLHVPAHALLFPIQVGTALSGSRFEGMLNDDAGNNISLKNPNYCELTAQYWAWKNEKADFYGFFHYRRYLAFCESRLIDKFKIEKKKLPPYEIRKSPDKETLTKLGYDRATMSGVISRYSVLAPLAEEMYTTVYNHYKQASFHDIKDLDLVLEIIEEKYPEYRSAAQKYMNSTKHYFGNIYVMSKEIFFNYCTWLFDILNEFDQRTDFSKYDEKSCRVDGYLAERLFGIYYMWLKRQQRVQWAELPRVHFEAFSGETGNFTIMRKINTLLPPGTRRRAWLKKLARIQKG